MTTSNPSWSQRRDSNPRSSVYETLAHEARLAPALYPPRLIHGPSPVPSDVVTAVWSSSQLGGFTLREAEVAAYYAEPEVLHLFSGESRLGDVRVDLDKASAATVRADVLSFVGTLPKQHFRTVVADPPYNAKYQAEYRINGEDFGGNEKNLGRLLKHMYRVCLPGGILIFKHWFDPAWAGAQLLHEVVTKYGGHRRITLLTVYRKSEWG